MSRPFKLNSSKSIAKKSKTIKHFVCDSADKKKFTFVYKAVKTGLKKQSNVACIYLPTKSKKRIVNGKEFLTQTTSTFNVDLHISRNDRKTKKRKLSTCSQSSSSGFESSRSFEENHSDFEAAVRSFVRAKNNTNTSREEVGNYSNIEVKVKACESVNVKACENMVCSKDSKLNMSVSPTSEYSSCGYEDSNVPSSAGISPNYQHVCNGDLLECDTIEVNNGNIIVSKSVLELNDDSADEIESEQFLVPESMENKVIETLDEQGKVSAKMQDESNQISCKTDQFIDNKVFKSEDIENKMSTTKETDSKTETKKEQSKNFICEETAEKVADAKQENASQNQLENNANKSDNISKNNPQNSTFVKKNYAAEWAYYFQTKHIMEQRMLEHHQQQYIQMQQNYYRQQQQQSMMQQQQWANYQPNNYQANMQQTNMQQNFNRIQNTDSNRHSVGRRYSRSPSRSRMSQRRSCVRSRNPSKDNRSGRSMCRSRSRDNHRSKSRAVSKLKSEYRNKDYQRSNSKETIVSSDCYRSKSRDPKAPRARSKSRGVGMEFQRSRMSVSKSCQRSTNSSKDKRSRRSMSRSVSRDNYKLTRSKSRSRSKDNNISKCRDFKQVENYKRTESRSVSKCRKFGETYRRSISKEKCKERNFKSSSRFNIYNEKSRSRSASRSGSEDNRGRKSMRRSHSRSTSRTRSESCSSLSSLASAVSKKLTKKKKKKQDKKSKKKSKKKHKNDRKTYKNKTRENSIDKSDFDESEFTVESCKAEKNEKRLSSVITQAKQQVSKLKNHSIESRESLSRDHYKHLLENDLRKKLREKQVEKKSKVAEDTVRENGLKSIKERIGTKGKKLFSGDEEKIGERKISIDR